MGLEQLGNGNKVGSPVSIWDRLKMNYEGGVPGTAQGDGLLDGDFRPMGNCTLS